MAQIIDFITHILLQLHIYTGSLAGAITVFTLLVRFLLFPFSWPMLKLQKQMRQLKPHLKELKKKHQGDKQAYAKAQMELYQKHNINPLGGCVPQLVQIGVAVILFKVLRQFVLSTEVQGVVINQTFLWMNLAHPDQFFVLPILVGFFQLLYSLMLSPAAETPDLVPNDSTKKTEVQANKKEEDFAEMAESMQQQMLYTMPVAFAVSTAWLPSGVALYIAITTLFSFVQQLLVSGPGGLVEYPQRAWTWIKQRGQV